MINGLILLRNLIGGTISSGMLAAQFFIFCQSRSPVNWLTFAADFLLCLQGGAFFCLFNGFLCFVVPFFHLFFHSLVERINLLELLWMIAFLVLSDFGCLIFFLLCLLFWLLLSLLALSLAVTVALRQL